MGYGSAIPVLSLVLAVRYTRGGERAGILTLNLEGRLGRPAGSSAVLRRDRGCLEGSDCLGSRGRDLPR